MRLTETLIPRNAKALLFYRFRLEMLAPMYWTFGRTANYAINRIPKKTLYIPLKDCNASFDELISWKHKILLDNHKVHPGLVPNFEKPEKSSHI